VPRAALRWLAAISLALALLPAPAPAREWQLEAAATARYGFMPDSFLDKLFEIHGHVEGFGPGLELGWTRDGFHATALCELLFVTTPDQVWLEKGAKLVDTKWVEAELKLLSVGLIFAYEFRIYGPVSIVPHMGYAPVYLRGQLTEYPTISSERGTSAEERTKAPDVEGEAIGLPKKFLGSDLGARLRVQPGGRWFISADLGWRMVIYSGLSAGIAF